MTMLSRRIASFAIALLGLAPTCWSQQQIVGRFSGTTLDPGWTLQGSAVLTAPAVDPDGSGWLRLTDAVNSARGGALHTGASFGAETGVRLSFSYAAWGGKLGGDGLSVFLFDATQDMRGGAPGGGLSYCQGAGGWLGIALDEYGNFSHPLGCGSGGGPGQQPQSLVIRGPQAAGYPYVAQVAMPDRVDRPEATARPVAAEVALLLLPKVPGPGYRLHVDWRGSPTDAWRRLLNGVDFPYAAPAALRVGVAATTGGAKNVHEVRLVNARVLVPVTVSASFDPAVVPPGGASSYVINLRPGAGVSALSEPLVVILPRGVTVTNPPVLGGTCPASLKATGGSDKLEVAAGSVIRPAGCSVTVRVAAAAAGAYTSSLAPGSVVTESGSNVAPAAATLTVR